MKTETIALQNTDSVEAFVAIVSSSFKDFIKASEMLVRLRAEDEEVLRKIAQPSTETEDYGIYLAAIIYKSKVTESTKLRAEVERLKGELRDRQETIEFNHSEYIKLFNQWLDAFFENGDLSKRAERAEAELNNHLGRAASERGSSAAPN